MGKVSGASFDAMFGDATEVSSAPKPKSRKNTTVAKQIAKTTVSQLGLEGWDEAAEAVQDFVPDKTTKITSAEKPKLGIEAESETFSEVEIKTELANFSNFENKDADSQNSEASKLARNEFLDISQGKFTPEVLQESKRVLGAVKVGIPKCEVFRNKQRVFVTYDKACVPKGDIIYSMLMAGHEVRLSGVTVKKSDYVKYGPVESDDDED